MNLARFGNCAKAFMLRESNLRDYWDQKFKFSLSTIILTDRYELPVYVRITRAIMCGLHQEYALEQIAV